MVLSGKFSDIITKDSLQLDIGKEKISNGTENVFHTDLKELAELVKQYLERNFKYAKHLIQVLLIYMLSMFSYKANF